VAAGKFRIDEPNPGEYILVCVEVSRHVVEEFTIVSATADELVLMSKEEGDYFLTVYFEKVAGQDAAITDDMGPSVTKKVQL